MEGTALDPRPLLERIWSIDLPSSTAEEQRWGDVAADQVRGWLDAWQAALHIEMTLPRPLPPDPPSDPADAAESSAGDASQSDDESVGGGDAEPEVEPLPNLGKSRPQPLSRQERERRARRALILSLIPLFAQALRDARISTGHVDTLATALADVSTDVRDRVIDRDEDLLAAALELSPDGFARTVRRFIDSACADEGQERLARQRRDSSFKHWVNKSTGMHCGYFQIDPERGVAMFGDIDAEIEALFHGGHAKDLSQQQVAAQALVNLIAAASGEARVSESGRGGGLVLIDIETLTKGKHEHSICETATGVSLPPDTVRRLMCLAEVTYAFTFRGKVMGLACEDRVANREQRRALQAMYRRCCFPGCEVPFARCHIHHVTFWERNGKTIIENLVPVCYEHHHLVHDHGWGLAMDADRTLTWTRPDGSVHAVCPFVPLAEQDLLATVDASSRAGPAPPPPNTSPPGAGPPSAEHSSTRPPPAGASDTPGTQQQQSELRLFHDNSSAA